MNSCGTKASSLVSRREPIKVMGPPYRMSRGQPTVRLGPPRLGEANDYVIRDLLGYTDWQPEPEAP